MFSLSTVHEHSEAVNEWPAVTLQAMTYTGTTKSSLIVPVLKQRSRVKTL